jgi:hypothetical protein
MSSGARRESRESARGTPGRDIETYSTYFTDIVNVNAPNFFPNDARGIR